MAEGEGGEAAGGACAGGADEEAMDEGDEDGEGAMVTEDGGSDDGGWGLEESETSRVGDEVAWGPERTEEGGERGKARGDG